METGKEEKDEAVVRVEIGALLMNQRSQNTMQSHHFHNI